MAQKRNMPSKKQVAFFWAEKLIDDYGKYWMDYVYENPEKTDEICFACGCWTQTERCHIIPRHNGGSDQVENIHCLCRECHIESEFLSEKTYWKWFLFKSPNNSGSYLRIRNLISLMKYDEKIEISKRYLS